MQAQLEHGLVTLGAQTVDRMGREAVEGVLLHRIPRSEQRAPACQASPVRRKRRPARTHTRGAQRKSEPLILFSTSP